MNEQLPKTKFKETEIGSIPEEWDVLTINELPIKIGDGNYSSKYPKVEELQDSGIPFISAKDLKNGKIRFNELRFISPELHSTLLKGHIRFGDTLLVTRADVGRVGFVTEEYEDANINAQLVYLRPDGIKIDKIFFYYLFSSSTYFDLLRNFSSGSAQSQLPIGAINEIPVIIPSKVEQIRIAEILSSLDDKIELNRQINANLEKIASALFKRWFVDFEFPDENGEPYKSSGGKMIESELGEIPDGWGVKSIYEIANVKNGAPFASKLFNEEKIGWPLVRIRDLKTLKPQYYTTEQHTKGFFVNPGDVIVGMDAEFTPWIWFGEKSLVNQRVCVFEPIDIHIHKYFIYKAIKPWLDYFENGNVGTTVIHLGKTDVDKFRILNAPDEIHRKFFNLIDPIFNQTIINAQEEKRLSQLRDSLLPRLMSGKIRINSNNI